ncbi:DUF3576 domain-containing protein [Pelagibacterales bacterium]|nr:DUF3576 domain-containing protein [Pelagibacterales bacterium]
MSNMFVLFKKTSSFAAFLAFLTFYGCSSLDIVPNKTERFKDAQESKGNTLEVESMTLTDRFKGMLPGMMSDQNFSNVITFEVALDQFSVMPLLSVDRVGGVIITDWYSTSSNLNERIKFNIIIKDENMNQDSIDINMFKENFNGTAWFKVKANKNTANKIKEIILGKARILKTTAELS